jgi:hypothetical protein
MSYDLFFYKRKDSLVGGDDIRNYLARHIGSSEDYPNQWIAENEDTGTYFSLELYEDTEEEIDEQPEFLDDFENTGLTFNINLIRPDFFGIEAFTFIDNAIKDLNLYVLNPQSNPERVSQPIEGDLYNNWSEINKKTSANFIDQMELEYIPIDKSNESYRYLANRKALQALLGDNYYVPQLYFFKYLPENKIVTVSTWTQSIPNVFPFSDYLFLVRKVKKLFNSVTETVVITSQTFNQVFGNFLSSTEQGYKIMHPVEAEKAKKLFNSIKADVEPSVFIGLPIEKLTNVKS